jgi:hypothetical protein
MERIPVVENGREVSHLLVRADFAARCALPGIELHLFADGDHRLTDRKERLWDLMAEFLKGRDLI